MMIEKISSELFDELMKEAKADSGGGKPKGVDPMLHQASKAAVRYGAIKRQGKAHTAEKMKEHMATGVTYRAAKTLVKGEKAKAERVRDLRVKGWRASESGDPSGKSSYNRAAAAERARAEGAGWKSKAGPSVGKFYGSKAQRVADWVKKTKADIEQSARSGAIDNAKYETKKKFGMKRGLMERLRELRRDVTGN